MSQYTASHSMTAVASKTNLYVATDGNVLPEVTYMEVAVSSTPADYIYEFSLRHLSALGTGGTAITPQKNGPGAASSAVAKGGTYSSDPTTTGSPLIKATVYHRQRWCVQKAVGEGFKQIDFNTAHAIAVYCDSVGTASQTINVVLNYVE